MTAAYREDSGRLFTLLELMRLYASAFAIVIARLDRGALCLPIAAQFKTKQPGWSVEETWQEVDATLRMADGVFDEHQFPGDLRRRLNRVKIVCATREPISAGAALQELAASIADFLAGHAYVMCSLEDYDNPLHRFPDAIIGFPEGIPNMRAASRCFALGEWDASVFHSMRSLEPVLKWLAGRINAGLFPLKATTNIDTATWGRLLDDIQHRIDEELRVSAPSSPERTARLAWYSRIAAELRYFKDAWRNFIFHDRNNPYDEGEASSVLGHVATFINEVALEKVKTADAGTV